MELILTSNGEYINTHCSTLGRCSDRLSEKGILDSLRLAKAVSDQDFDFIFCSDIGFRRTTTDLIVESLRCEDYQIIVDPKLREKGAEICTQLTEENFKKSGTTDPEQAKILSRLFIKSESIEHSEGTYESDEQLRERCQAFLQELTKTYPSDATVLIVGNPILNSFLIALITEEIGKEIQYFAPACALSHFRFRAGKREVLSLNQTEHLYGARS